MSDILPAGNAIYQETHNGMCIQGISYSEEDLNQSAQIVADICFDTIGQKNFENYILSLSDTGFRQINAVLPKVRDWQVGEGFAFGEVKTSAEQKYPPQVTSKKDDGLNTQLKKLCHDYDRRRILVQYLFNRVKGTTEYKEACIAYLKDNKNFYVFGVLVRNVEPHIKDWNYLKKHLEVHEQNRVSLLALYLPQNDGIQKLHAYVLSKGAKT